MALPHSLHNRKWSPAKLGKLIYEALAEVDEFLGDKFTEEQKDFAKNFVWDLYFAVNVGQELQELPNHDKVPGPNSKGFHCMLEVLDRLTRLSFQVSDEDEAQTSKENVEISPTPAADATAQTGSAGNGVEQQVVLSPLRANATSFRPANAAGIALQGPCGICGQKDHHISLCPSSRCRICRGAGHMTFRCPMATGALFPASNLVFPVPVQNFLPVPFRPFPLPPSSGAQSVIVSTPIDHLGYPSVSRKVAPIINQESNRATKNEQVEPPLKFDPLRILKTQGYEEGKGLGPNGMGIIKPVEAAPVRKKENRHAGLGVVHKGPNGNQKPASSGSKSHYTAPPAHSKSKVAETKNSSGKAEAEQLATLLKDCWPAFKEIQEEKKQQQEKKQQLEKQQQEKQQQLEKHQLEKQQQEKQRQQQQATSLPEKFKHTFASSSGLQTAPPAPAQQKVDPILQAPKVENDSDARNNIAGEKHLDVSKDRLPVQNDIWGESHVQQYRISALFKKTYPSSSSSSGFESPPKPTPPQAGQASPSMQKTAAGIVAAINGLFEPGVMKNVGSSSSNSGLESPIKPTSPQKGPYSPSVSKTAEGIVSAIHGLFESDVIKDMGSKRGDVKLREESRTESQTESQTESRTESRTEYAARHQAADPEVYRRSLIKHGVFSSESPSRNPPQRQPAARPEVSGKALIEYGLLSDEAPFKETPKLAAAKAEAFRKALIKYGLPLERSPAKTTSKQEPVSVSIVESPPPEPLSTRSKKVLAQPTKPNFLNGQTGWSDKGKENVPPDNGDSNRDVKLENKRPAFTSLSKVQPKVEQVSKVKNPLFEQGDLIAWD